MKFDFIIGNPPYQEDVSIVETQNGQKRSRSIFQFFQTQVDDIADTGSVLIYPGGRWIHQSGKGMLNFGHEQINDVHLTRLDYYPLAKDVFDTVAIADGISIVCKCYHKNESGFEYRYIKNGKQKIVEMKSPGNNLFILNPDDVPIVESIDCFVDEYHIDYLDKYILSQKLFGIESDFVEKNAEDVRLYSGEYDKFDPATEVKLLTNDKAGKSGRAKWYVSNKNIITNNAQYINEWQVVVSSANAGGQKRDNQLEIIDNHSAFGRARVALRSFKTQEEAENFYNYVKSYIIRFAFLMTDEALSSLGKKVPDILDYSSSNKILDFTADIDEQLYKILDLSPDEIVYVQERVDGIRRK